eukprot:9186462-Lingulodinium_polyedra.AAC.1
MRRPAMGPSVLTVKHAKAFVDIVHAGTIEQEVRDATTYCQALIGGPDWMLEVGSAAATTTPQEVMKKKGGRGDPRAVPCGPGQVRR